jgi:hypothetical protein
MARAMLYLRHGRRMPKRQASRWPPLHVLLLWTFNTVSRACIYRRVTAVAV